MSRNKLLTSLLDSAASAVLRAPWWVIGVYLVLVAASIALTATKLEFKTDTNDLISTDQDYNQRYLKFLDEFGDLESVVALRAAYQ